MKLFKKISMALLITAFLPICCLLIIDGLSIKDLKTEYLK